MRNLAECSGPDLAAEMRIRIAEMTPADVGRLMRTEGAPRWANPYSTPLCRDAWIEGWSEADTKEIQ
jgi:hypothetical protein